jgi:hypothetical protein
MKGSFSDGKAGEYADIGYLGANPELLLYCDSLTLELACGGSEDEIYEIVLKLYADGLTVEADATISGGERSVLAVDTSMLPSDTRVDALRICARRVTGEGDYELQLYKISLNSKEYTSDELYAALDAAKDDLEGKSENSTTLGRIVTAVVIVMAVSILTVAAAISADKKRKKQSNER